MKFFSIFLLIAASVLAGCAGGTGAYPTLDPVLDDWCFTFDFHADAQGFAIDAGEQNILGLQTDPDGLLLVSYGYDRRILASTVIISVRRPEVSDGDITVRADGHIFNIKTQLWDAVIPAAVEQLYVPYGNTDPIQEDALLEDPYKSINIHLESDKPLVIESIQLRGNGASPFPENECQAVTNTPTADPGTPFGSETPTPSGTPVTVTSTGTITATPTCEPTTSIEDGWVYADIVSHSGDTWVVDATAFDLGYHIQWGATDGSAGTVLWHSYTENIGSVNSGSTMDASGSLVPLSSLPQTVQHISLYSPDPLTITFIFEEQGETCGPTPTPGPTNTAGPTNTPGPTNTSSPLWSACLDFKVDPFGFTAVGSDYVRGQGFVQDDDEWGFGRSGLVNGRKSKLRIRFKPGQTFTGNVRLSDGVNHTAWKAVSGNFITPDFTGDTHIPNTTMYVEFDGNNLPLTAEMLCWVDPNPPTKTPMPFTGTPPSRTPYPFASPTLTATSYRTPIAPFVVTSTPGVFITRTMTGGGGGGGTPSASSTPGGGTGGTGGTSRGSGDAGDVLLAVWDVGTGLFEVAGAYMGQVGDAAGGLLSAVNNATPISISGLPQCMTNPMAHDICAIYYILDFTLFSPNTPGALIIPLVMVLMNFVIVIRFIRWGWKIVRRGEEVTSE